MTNRLVPVSVETLSLGQLKAAENIGNGRISQVYRMGNVRVMVLEGQEDKAWRWNGNVWEVFIPLALTPPLPPALTSTGKLSN